MKGSVAVVGGGIAGIQAALDLADSGFKTYLIESRPSIGGVMSQLDKTFPTNDCAMCILSPKLVETARHPNIELLSYSDVKSISGKAGDFKVKVVKKARYVDETKCTGCGSCTEKCPSKVQDEYNAGMSQAQIHLYPVCTGDTQGCNDRCSTLHVPYKRQMRGMQESLRPKSCGL